MLIDTHVHLDDLAFEGRLDDVCERAREQGIHQFVTIGTNLASCERALKIAERMPSVVVAVGIHPHEAATVTDEIWRQFEVLAAHPCVRALGETGLDYYRDYAPREAQEELFRRTLRLAAARRLPVVIHTREASEDTVKILKDEHAEIMGGVFHCFSGDSMLLSAAKDLEFYVAVGGAVTYPKADGLRAAVKDIPEARLVLETDAPYLPPQPHRGKTNEPAFMRLTAEKVADVREMSLEKLGALTSTNAKRLFRL